MEDVILCVLSVAKLVVYSNIMVVRLTRRNLARNLIIERATVQLGN